MGRQDQRGQSRARSGDGMTDMTIQSFPAADIVKRLERELEAEHTRADKLEAKNQSLRDALNGRGLLVVDELRERAEKAEASLVEVRSDFDSFLGHHRATELAMERAERERDKALGL